MAPADRRKESVMSDYFDYMELKKYVYGLYKDGIWESLSQEIKCLYWRDLQRLWRKVEMRTISLEQIYEENGYEPVDSFSVEDYIIQQEINQELYVAIKTLDEQKQRIIELYYFEDQTEREIGDNIGKAQRTVNYQKDKSHKELKKIMRKLF